MTTELRHVLNIRLGTDSNISISVGSLIDTEQEAREAGTRNAVLVDAYMEAYNKACKPKPKEDE